MNKLIALIVDDEPMVVDLLCAACETYLPDLKILTAKDFSIARQVFTTNQEFIKLIIIDGGILSVNGWQFAEYIISECGCADVLIYSNSGREVDKIMPLEKQSLFTGIFSKESPALLFKDIVAKMSIAT